MANIIDSMRVRGVDYLLKDSTVSSQLQTLEQSLLNRIQGIVGAAPLELDTLKEIADALSNNDSAIDSIMQTISTKASTDYVDLAISNIELTPGPQGETGEQGPQGEKGEKGDQGETGPQGPAGTFDSSALENYALASRLGGLSFVKITLNDYDNLLNKDSNTLYVIV